MVGLVIAAHGHLAEELVSTAHTILGPLPQVAACVVEQGGEPSAFKTRLKDAIHQVNSGEGVLVLVDVLGGSPCTQSLALCVEEQLEVVTGVNLPMVLKAHSLRATPLALAELATELVQQSQRSITQASTLLKAAVANH